MLPLIEQIHKAYDEHLMQPQRNDFHEEHLFT